MLFSFFVCCLNSFVCQPYIFVIVWFYEFRRLVTIIVLIIIVFIIAFAATGVAAFCSRSLDVKHLLKVVDGKGKNERRGKEGWKELKWQ